MKIDILNNNGECDDDCPFRVVGRCVLFDKELTESWKQGNNSPNWVACDVCNKVVNQQEINEMYYK